MSYTQISIVLASRPRSATSAKPGSAAQISDYLLWAVQRRYSGPIHAMTSATVSTAATASIRAGKSAAVMALSPNHAPSVPVGDHQHAAED